MSVFRLFFYINLILISALSLWTAFSRKMISSASKNIRLVFVDFDKTCTTHDTTGLLYKATKVYRESDQVRRQAIDRKWSHVSEQYLNGYMDLLAKFPPLDEAVPAYDKEGLELFLRSLSNFEKNMTEEVESMEILKSVDKAGIEEIAGQVYMYDGCREFLRKMGATAYIVSLNWSRYLLSVCLRGSVMSNQILANELGETNVSRTGYLSKHLRDAFDKREIVALEIKKNKSHGLTVYIGDSPSDFLAMLATDLAILIGNSKTAKIIATRYGILLKPLKDYDDIYKNCWSNDFENHCLLDKNRQNNRKTIYQVSSWKEIDDFFM